MQARSAAAALETGPTPGTFTVSRASTATNEATIVHFVLGGSAGYGTDYTVSPSTGTVVIAAGASNAAVVVTPVPDPFAEPSETVTLSLLPGLYAVGAASNATVSITDAALSPVTNQTVAPGDWSAATNWSLSRVPAAGDDIIVGHNLLLGNTTPWLKSCTVAGATLTFTNWGTTLTAVDVEVSSGGVLSLPAPFSDAAMSNNVVIACSNVLVAMGGKIDVDGRGYAGGPDAGHTNGYGPGGGIGAPTSQGGGGGGGNGGRGGGGHWGYTIYMSRAGATCGEAAAPALPGSGGGVGSGGTAYGGDGGGAVRIQASGAVVVDGTITARGTGGYVDPGSQYSAGCGAGGSIWISCNTFAGAGGVLADGGDPLKFGQAYSYMQGGGGGGGRITIDYDPVAQLAAPDHSVRFSSAGGHDLAHMDFGWFGELGTLSFTDAAILATPDIRHSGALAMPGLTNWVRNDLVLSNAWFRVPQNAFRITLTNDLAITGSAGSMNRFELTNATVTCGGDLRQSAGTFAMYSSDPLGSSLTCRDLLLSGGSSLYLARGGDAATTLSCGRDLAVDGATFTYYFPSTNPVCFTVNGSVTLTNAGHAYVHGGMTNAAGADHGGLVQVRRDILIASGSWVHPYSHPANGGSALFQARNITITAADAGFDANKAGYPQGPAATSDGYGPGRGKGGWNSTGGGYGGLGGKALPGYGQTYGSSNAPVDPGSAGGLGNAPWVDSGGLGGGVIRLDIESSLTVNGVLKADGGDHAGQNNYGGGGGAGGSIYVVCRRLAGINPVFSAKGGVGCDNRNTAGSGGGGGGRIAICRTVDVSVGATANVDGALGYRTGVPAGSGDMTGAPGTIVWGFIPFQGTLFLLR